MLQRSFPMKHTISSGERMPNCTASTRRIGAEEYGKGCPLIAGDCYYFFTRIGRDW